ncbi:MAB_1171c family putative transporter [Nocardia sp. NPDC057440]|uniref:MAB_1171c family putative transporter n=1 Tax=Nocardia sp. NPDC057440 TaxID=3346134 RepID=UPI00366EC9B3
MNTPAPTWLAVLTVVVVCVVTVARWRFADDSVADRLINRALSWVSLDVIVAQFGVWFGAAEMCHLIFLALCPIAVANLYGLAGMFAGADPGTARLRQRRYDAVGVLGGGAILVIGQPMDYTGAGFWWRAACYWAIFNVPTTVAATLLIRACIRELRGGARLRELVAYGALLILAVGWYFAAIRALWQIRDQVAPGGSAVQWGVVSCAFGILVPGITAMPLLNGLLTRCGLDRAGRDLRRLRPLWRDLTDAVPEIAMRSEVGHVADPRAQLYRMVVEIRDALLHLRRYAPPEGSSEYQGAAGYARLVARAVHQKASGAAPAASGQATDLFLLGGEDLSADLGHLLALSRAWPRVGGARGVPNR